MVSRPPPNSAGGNELGVAHTSARQVQSGELHGLVLRSRALPDGGSCSTDLTLRDSERRHRRPESPVCRVEETARIKVWMLHMSRDFLDGPG
jgi:hypothetical protein